MAEEDLSFVTAGGDHVDHAGRKTRFLPQFGEPQGCLRAEAGGFQYQAVAGRDADGSHPSLRDHGGEVPGSDAGEHAEGVVIAGGVVAGGDVHESVALHDVRRTHRELDDFHHLEHIAHGFIPLLTVLCGTDAGQLVEILLNQGLHLEEHLNALSHRGIGPCGIGLLGGRDREFDFVRGALRSVRDDRARGRVVARHVLAGLGFDPLTTGMEFEPWGPFAADGVPLDCVFLEEVTVFGCYGRHVRFPFP